MITRINSLQNLVSVTEKPSCSVRVTQYEVDLRHLAVNQKQKEIKLTLVLYTYLVHSRRESLSGVFELPNPKKSKQKLFSAKAKCFHYKTRCALQRHFRRLGARMFGDISARKKKHRQIRLIFFKMMGLICLYGLSIFVGYLKRKHFLGM